MDNNRYFIYRRSEVFFVWANYQKWRQRFSILQQRSVFSSYVVADTGRAVPEATLPGDQLVAGRNGCSRRRKKRAKTVAEERGDPDFFASLHQRENRISRWPIIFREGSILAPRLPPSPPLPSPLLSIANDRSIRSFITIRMVERRRRILLLYTR